MGGPGPGRRVWLTNVDSEVPVPAGYDFVVHLTRLCRALRNRGFLVGPRETADAVRATGLVDAMDRRQVYWTLRTLLPSRLEDIGAFDELFGTFWDFDTPVTSADLKGEPPRPGGMGEFRRLQQASPLFAPGERHADDLVQVVRTGASADKTALHQGPPAPSDDELSELGRIADRVVRALSSRPGRRRRRHRRKGTPDIRGAFRLNLGTGGDLIRLPRLSRVPRVPRLLLLVDVSGSMDQHSRLLLQLAYAVAQRTRRVETFVFSTSVTRVTRALRAQSFGDALRRIGEAAEHWSGGTRIGECLAHINARYGMLQNRYTSVFLLSDGWDAGDPADLAREMRRIQRRVRTVVWLNPLLGTRDYRPATRGLMAVTPYVDHFVSAMDVSHLRRLPRLLRF